MPYVNKPRDIVSCLVCGTGFERKSSNHVYCCKACKRTTARGIGGAETTERQYALISGNWEKYFGRLCTRAFRRDLLSKHDCIALLEAQDYKCALTGLESHNQNALHCTTLIFIVKSALPSVNQVFMT